MERHKKNAVVLVDCVFIFLNRDNDCSGYETLAAKFERKACPVAQKGKKKKHKKRGPESPPFISHGVLHSFHRFTTFLTTLTPRLKLIFTI